jgi:hypothetical protein
VKFNGALQEESMVALYGRLKTTAASLTVDHLANRDEDVLQALVTAGAVVPLSDGRLEAAERDERVVNQQGFVPSISRHEIAVAFDRVRHLANRHRASTIMETLRPVRSSAPIGLPSLAN